MGRIPQRPVSTAGHRCPVRGPLRALSRHDVARVLGALDRSKRTALFRAAGLRLSPGRAADRAPDLVRARLRSLDDTAAHNVAVACVDLLRAALADFTWDCDDDDVVPQIERLLPALLREWSPSVLRLLFATAADIGAIGGAEHSAITALIDSAERAAPVPAEGPLLAADTSEPSAPESSAPVAPAPATSDTRPSALDELVRSTARRGVDVGAVVEELLDLEPLREGSWFLAGFASGWNSATPAPPTTTTAATDAMLRGRLAALTERGATTEVAEVVRRAHGAIERILRTSEGQPLAAGIVYAMLDADPSRASALLRLPSEPFPGYRDVLAHAADTALRLLDRGRVALAEQILAACDETITLWSATARDETDATSLERAAAAIAIRRVSCRRQRSDFVGAADMLDRVPPDRVARDDAARAAEERALIAVELGDPRSLAFPRRAEDRARLSARLERAEASIEHAVRAAPDRAAPHLLAGLLALTRRDDRRASVELGMAKATWPSVTPEADRDTEPAGAEAGHLAAIGFHAALARARLLEPGTDEAAATAMLDALAAGYQPGPDHLAEAIHALEAHGAPQAADIAVAAFGTSPTNTAAVNALIRHAQLGHPSAVAAAGAVTDEERVSLADRFEILSAAARGAHTAGAPDELDVAVDGVERVLTRVCDPALELRWAVSLGTGPLRDAVGPLYADARRVDLLRRAGAPDEAAAITRGLFYRAAADREAPLDAHDLLELMGELGVDDEELASLARLVPAASGAPASSATADEASVRLRRVVKVLFVGGNEVQARYHAAVDDHLGSTYGGQVSVEWFTPGWSANWGQEAARVEAAYPTSDALVLMSFVRTLLGRRLRRTAGEAGLPWIACTGHGRASLERAVERAVAVVAR